MVGLLPALSRASLLSPRPVERAAPEDEAMAARFLAEQRASEMRGLMPTQSAPAAPQMGMGGLLSQVQALPAPQAPMQRERGRVNPARVLSRFILGGEDPFQAADAERERLQAEADRPAAMQRMAMMRSAAQRMGPEAVIAFETNPEAFGESLGMQFRPVTTAEGSITTFGPGAGSRQVAAPIVERFDDRYGIVDPLRPQAGVTYTDPRGPTRAETTAEARLGLDAQKLAADNAIAEGNLGVAQGRLALDEQTAGYTVGPGQTRFDAQGNPIASVAPAAQAVPAAVTDLRGRISSIETDVTPTLGRMKQLLTSGDVIAGFGAEARLTAAKAAAALGNQDARRQVAATEEYRNTAARLRVGMAKSLGANPSNADLVILEQVTGGDINQSRDALLATLSQGEQMAARQMNAAQQELARLPGGAPQTNSAPIQVTSRQQFEALPSGTLFIAPDGSTRRKP